MTSTQVRTEPPPAVAPVAKDAGSAHSSPASRSPAMSISSAARNGASPAGPEAVAPSAAVPSAASSSSSAAVAPVASAGSSDAASPPPAARRPSFGLNFLNSLTSSMRTHAAAPLQPSSSASEPLQPPVADARTFMSNSPTIGNFTNYNAPSIDAVPDTDTPDTSVAPDTVVPADTTVVPVEEDETAAPKDEESGRDKDGFYSVRLTPLIDHSSSNSGLYFAPVIRKAKAASQITIGRYTEKNKAAAHAPQGSSAPIVFKSKVVSRTHALFQCNDDGQWFIKDSKSSSGTFLNHIRLSPASQESSLMPLIDGDIVQLGMDYRGGTEEVYRCVKMRCEFNKSWQRKVNQFNLEIHQKLKNLAVSTPGDVPQASNPINNALKDELSECAICLLKLEPCQALFISPCSHSWHYKCIRPIIIKSYPQFYCPNCRSMCDLETDIEDDD